MTCPKGRADGCIFSRYIGSEEREGITCIKVGCKECPRTILFAREAKLNRTLRDVLARINGETTPEQIRAGTGFSRGHVVRIVRKLHDARLIRTIRRGVYVRRAA